MAKSIPGQSSDVRPGDVRGFDQCHFFAGIGGWSYALRLADWDDSRAVWTGSCPCQPWSVAGDGIGPDDPRDLWPSWLRLWRVVRPAVCFGEQVAGKSGLYWLDRMQGDVEALAYAVGSCELPACSVGADHVRRRLWWVADSDGSGWERREPHMRAPVGSSASLAISRDAFAGARRLVAGGHTDLLPRDGLSVQVERDALRGYGNAIVPQVAAEFIRAYIDSR